MLRASLDLEIRAAGSTETTGWLLK